VVYEKTIIYENLYEFFIEIQTLYFYILDIGIIKTTPRYSPYKPHEPTNLITTETETQALNLMENINSHLATVYYLCLCKQLVIGGLKARRCV
jgi:hypothetical protein